MQHSYMKREHPLLETIATSYNSSNPIKFGDELRLANAIEEIYNENRAICLYGYTQYK